MLPYVVGIVLSIGVALFARLARLDRDRAFFVIAAVAGFKGSAWIIVGALAGHGVQDAFHGHIVANAGVPAWWPAWCLAYDVGAAAVLAWFLMRGDLPSTATSICSGPHADVVGVTK
jgi:hypothetical protein